MISRIRRVHSYAIRAVQSYHNNATEAMKAHTKTFSVRRWQWAVLRVSAPPKCRKDHVNRFNQSLSRPPTPLKKKIKTWPAFGEGQVITRKDATCRHDHCNSPHNAEVNIVRQVTGEVAKWLHIEMLAEFRSFGRIRKQTTWLWWRAMDVVCWLKFH